MFETEINVDVNSIKKDIGIISYLIIKTIWDDIAYFNRNGIGKKTKTGLSNWIYQYYNVKYYNELVSDLKSDWFKNLCNKWGLDYDHAFSKFINNRRWISSKISNVDLSDSACRQHIITWRKTKKRKKSMELALQ